MITRFWDWVDSRMVVRRCVLAAAAALTVWSVLWSMRFAELIASYENVSLSDGALLVTAVTTPIMVMCGYVFGAYFKARTPK